MNRKELRKEPQKLEILFLGDGAILHRIIPVKNKILFRLASGIFYLSALGRTAFVSPEWRFRTHGIWISKDLRIAAFT